MNIVIKEKNVFNRTLANELHEHTKNTITFFLDIAVDMEACELLIDMFLRSEADDSQLHQINVIADKRNNNEHDMQLGKFKIDVYYKQLNCYNTTHVSYLYRK